MKKLLIVLSIVFISGTAMAQDNTREGVKKDVKETKKEVKKDVAQTKKDVKRESKETKAEVKERAKEIKQQADDKTDSTVKKIYPKAKKMTN